MNDDPLWESSSDSTSQLLLAIGCLLVGIAILALSWSSYHVDSNHKAAFFLGALLGVIGLAGVVTSGRQQVTVDARSRRVTVRDEGRFGAQERVIEFADIADIRMGNLGKRSNHVMIYYLVLVLRNGKEYPLFAPGRMFAGCTDRLTVDGWRKRLQRMMTA